MSNPNASRRTGRSILSLLAGFVVVVILSIATDVILHVAGILPPLGQRTSDPLLLLATAYRTVYGVLGSYVTARLAPYSPMAHALIGGAIGIVLATAGAAATWHAGPAFGPHWYPVALIVLAMPQSWAGGMLRILQLRSTS